MAAIALLVGCTRRATEADCQLIVDRVIEVELRAMRETDGAIIEQKKAELRPTLKDDLKDCTGRRISNAMLDCVKKADTSEGIYDCIR